MKFQLFIGASFIYIACFILIYNRIPDVLYAQATLTDNIKYIFSSIFFLFGLYCLLVAYKMYKKRNQKKIPKYSKCSKCKETYIYYKLKEGMCPKCGITTSDMEEYYKIHKE